MKRFLIKSGIGFLLFILFTSMLVFGVNKLYLSSQIFKPMALLNFKERPTHIILGSSRALTTLNTKLIEESRPSIETWYNLSMDDSSPEIHLLLLKMLIENGVKPKHVYLQYDRSKLPESLDEWKDKDYRFIPLIYHSQEVSEYFSRKKNFWIVKGIPVSSYAYFNSELLFPAVFLLKNQNYRHRYDSYGDVSYPNNVSVNWTGKGRSVLPAHKDGTLEQIKKLCSEQGIHLTIFIAPFLSKSYNTERHPDFINFSDSLKDPSLYYDMQHLNAKGKQAFTNIFINQVLKH